jgi:hypothetical protein
MRLETQFRFFPRSQICYSPDWDGNAGEINPLSFLPDRFDDFSKPLFDPPMERPLPPLPPMPEPPKPEFHYSEEPNVAEIMALMHETAREDNHPPYGHHINLETWIPLRGTGEGRFMAFGNDHIKLDDDKKD